MNPVNATALYVSACRSLLQCDPKDPETYGGLFNVLPFFRESLSCLVCGEYILNKAMYERPCYVLNVVTALLGITRSEVDVNMFSIGYSTASSVLVLLLNG